MEDFGRKIVELGWESFVDNWENWVDGWKNCDGNLKSWVDDWKNYDYDWNIGSDLNGFTMSDHCCFGSMRYSGDFSSHDCTLARKNYYWAMKRPHSSVQEIVVELGTLDTPQTHDSWLDSKYNPELKIDHSQAITSLCFLRIILRFSSCLSFKWEAIMTWKVSCSPR